MLIYFKHSKINIKAFLFPIYVLALSRVVLIHIWSSKSHRKSYQITWFAVSNDGLFNRPPRTIPIKHRKSIIHQL
jgi:hypothetical protein